MRLRTMLRLGGACLAWSAQAAWSTQPAGLAPTAGPDSIPAGREIRLPIRMVSPDSGLPLPGIRLYVSGLPDTLATDSAGWAEFTPASRDTLRIRAWDALGNTQDTSLAPSAASAPVTWTWPPGAYPRERPGPDPLPPVNAAAPDTAGALELDEKVVKARGTRVHRQKEVSRVRLGREQLQKVAAAQGDPLKVLGLLPGVSNQNDFSVRPFVRGGKAEETQVLWEGIPLLQPYHFGSIYSIFNTESLEDMTLHSGGFPAHAGNALSAALFMKARPAPLDSLRLFADLSMLRGNAYVGVPIVKNRLGVSFSYQALWYDWVIDRSWDVMDVFVDDTAFTNRRRQFQSYLDLPNFKDFQFGLNWKAGEHLGIDYTGLVSRDIFTTRETKNRLFVNGKEVSPGYYDRNLFFHPNDIREKKSVWDTLAVVEVDDGIHSLRFHWRPGEDWEVDQTLAYQFQTWHVGFFDNVVWTETRDSADNFAGYRVPGESDLLFGMRKEAYDWKLDLRHQASGRHRLAMGLAQSIRATQYDTRLPRPVYEVLVNGNVDALDALGYFDPDGFAIRRDDPGADPNADYLLSLPRLIRFDHQGRQSGSFLAAYASDEWLLDEGHRLTLGLRGEADSYSKQAYLSPRLAYFQSLGPKDELTLAWGLYSQSDLPFFMRDANPNLAPEKAFHFNAEWTHAFSPRYRLEVQAYQKNYYDLVVTTLANTGRINWSDGPLEGLDSARFVELDPALQKILIDRFGEKRFDYRNGGLGKAGGVEASFFYDPNRIWSGWLSAEACYSRRMDHPGERTYPFRYHRPWAFNWNNYFKMPSRYELSLRGRFAAGQPYTDYALPAPEPAATNGVVIANDTLFYAGPRNGKRYVAYSRWDLRLSKETRLWGHGLHSYFEIWNVFNAPNAFLRDSRTGSLKFLDINYPVPILFLGFSYRL